MLKVGFIFLLLFLFSCSQGNRTSSNTPTFFYVGSNKIEDNIDILEQPVKIDEQLILYSNSQQAHSNSLYMALASKNFHANQYSISKLTDYNFSGTLLIFLLTDPNDADIDIFNLFLENNLSRVSILIADSSASRLFFRKIANPFIISDSLVSKVGVNEVKITNGLNLIGLPIVLVKAATATRFSEMLSASLQNPSDYVISLDDSTLLSICNNVIKVYGKGQMFMVKHPEASTKVDNGLFGGENLQISVYLPGDSVIIK